MPNIFETDSTCFTNRYNGSNIQENTEYQQNILSICSDMSNLKISTSENENALVSSEKCDVCDTVFTSQVHAKQHFEGKRHQKKVQSQPNAVFSNSSPENSIHTQVDLNNEYKCDVCDVVFTSQAIAKQHFEGKRHLKNVQSQPGAVFSNSSPEDSPQGFHIPVINQNKCELCDVVFTSTTNAADHLKGKTHLKTVSVLKMNNKLECDTCGVAFSGAVDAKAHYTGRKHQRATENKTTLPKLIAECSASLPSRSSLADENYSDKCKICDVVLTSQINAKQHFEGWKHQRKVQSQDESISSNATPGTSFGFPSPADKTSIYQHKCEVCDVILTSAANADEHRKGKNHLKNVNLKTIHNDFVHHTTDKQCNINNNCNQSSLKNFQKVF